MSAHSQQLRERITGFLAWSAVAGFVLAPLAFYGSLYFKLFGRFNSGPLPGSYEDTVFQLRSAAIRGDTGPITSGQSPEDRAKQIVRLRGFVAGPEMAANWAKQIKFLFLTFSGPPGASQPGQKPDGYRSLALNFTQRAGDPDVDAYVIFADQPVRWTITADGLQTHSRVGFEGSAAFDVTSAPPNLIAGYRIGAFGGGETARPSLADRNNTQGVNQFCGSLAAWTKYFGVTIEDMQAFTLADASTILASGAAFASPGAIMTPMSGQEINGLCKNRF